jgi:hypothetical protein
VATVGRVSFVKLVVVVELINVNMSSLGQVMGSS